MAPDRAGHSTRRVRRVVAYSPYPADGPSARHRVYAYAPSWAAQGVSLRVLPFMTRRFYRIRRRFSVLATLEKLLWFALCTLRLLVRLPAARSADVVLIHREAFPLGPAFVEQLIARLAPAVVFDLDDALWQPPSNRINQRGLFWNSGRVDDIVAASRHVVVGNPLLADRLRGHGRPVTTIPTPYADLAPPPRRAGADGGPPVVVWIGNDGNAWYVGEILPALERAARRLAFRLRLIGGRDIDGITSASLEIERIRWSEAAERLLVKADIGIMPLPDRDYERGKSGFKIVQYWSAGLAVLAAAVGSNCTMIEHGRNGLLARSAEDWETSLSRLLADVQLRASLASGGRQRYLTSYTREVNAAAWLSVFEDAAGAVAR